MLRWMVPSFFLQAVFGYLALTLVGSGNIDAWHFAFCSGLFVGYLNCYIVETKRLRVKENHKDD